VTSLAKQAAGWPIQVFDRVAMSFLPLLRETLLEPALLATPTYPSLNQGAWKSNEHFFDYAPSTRVLRDEITKLLVANGGLGAQRRMDRCRLIGWAMVNRSGSFHPTHRHQTAIQSGVYYVAGGDPPVGTIFEHADGSEETIEAIPGRLVVFPGNLWHRVPIYSGTEPRITIAFDVRRI
jgi:hypothetical protein